MADPQIHPDRIDAEAQKVIRRLVRNGYEAFLVGGCVRDLLLDRTPKDFDLATSATPSEVRDLFRNCRIIGRRFRLAHIFFGQKIIETATFRANPREVLGEGEAAEGEAAEGESAELLIHRDNVFGTAEEDARRRDFTINGLFYDLEAGQVIDYVGGLADLRARSMRTIGDPDIRFREDPVRILRAIKFAARLGFDIEDTTYRAVITHREEIEKSAPPRVLEEIYRLLRGGAALESIFLLRETGILRVLVPDLERRLERDPMALDPYLRAIDQSVGRGEMLSNAALLVLLLSADLAPLFDEQAGDRLRDPVAFIDSIIGPIFDRMRVARRDLERARLILLGQRRIWQMRRRPGKTAGLVSRDWFQDALLLHGMHRLAAGASETEAWGELRGLRQSGGGQAAVRRGPWPGAGPGPRGGGDDIATVSEALDDEGSAGRRRRGRRRPGEGERPPAEDRPARSASGESAGTEPGDEEPLENEEAALRAFAAAMSAPYDD